VATPTKPMTFAVFERLPDRQELRHGEVVEMPPPKHCHFVIQRRQRELVTKTVAEQGIDDTELDGHIITHRSRQIILLAIFKTDPLPVDSIFAD
jgi:hypothetical protein